MDMMFVLGILTIIFFTSLIIMCFYRTKINVKLWNIIFVIADFLAYSCWSYASYQHGWLDDGWMTLDNISPLMFTVILLCPFMNEKVRSYAYSAIAFLNFGMLVAMYVSPEYTYLYSYAREASFLYTSEAVCHMLCSLFGIYLVLSNQVKADFKHWVKSITFLLPIITFGVILNYIYHKSHFGMDPYGHASIYMIDIFGSYEATLVAYYFGVVMVLTVGMQAVGLIDKITDRLHHGGDGENLDTYIVILDENGGDSANNGENGLCDEALCISKDDIADNGIRTDENTGTNTNENTAANVNECTVVIR